MEKKDKFGMSTSPGHCQSCGVCLHLTLKEWAWTQVRDTRSLSKEIITGPGSERESNEAEEQHRAVGVSGTLTGNQHCGCWKPAQSHVDSNHCTGPCERGRDLEVLTGVDVVM